MTYRLRNITIAIALALVAALLTSFYVSNYQRDVRADETNVPIFVAARDIPAGTTGANAVQKGMLTKSRDRPAQRRSRRDLEPGPARRPRGDAGDLRRRADHEPTLRRSVRARNPRAADRAPAGDRRLRRQAAAPRRHAPKRRPRRRRRHVLGPRERPAPLHPHRPPRRRRVCGHRRSASATANKIARRRQLRRDAQGARQPGAEAALGLREREGMAPPAAAGHRRRRQPGEPGELRTRCSARASARSSSTRPGRTTSRQWGAKLMSDSIRIYVTGSCDGLEQLRDALSTHPELDFVGWSEHVGEATAALAGGHLQVVVHATRSTRLPGGRDRSDPRADARADRHPRLGRVVRAARRRARRRRRRRRPPAPAADGERRLRAPQGEPRRPPPACRRRDAAAAAGSSPCSRRRAGRARPSRRRTSPPRSRSTRGSGRSCSTSTSSSATPRSCSGSSPSKTIYDLVVAPGELDSEKLAGYITKHTCGLDVLPAPLRPEDAELVTESKLARLLEVARESYDVIVVDTSPFFHGPMLATLDRTDELMMICGLDVPTLKNVRLSLQTLELLSFPASRIRFVLNRANSKVGMKKSEVEGALDVKIGFEVPSDRAVPLGVNRGDAARARRHRLGLRQGCPRASPSRCSSRSSRRRSAAVALARA